jgi:biotin carboxylase
MKRVLVAFPTAWDRRQLAACRECWEGRLEIAWGEPSDADCPSELDPVAWVEENAARWGGRIDGVFSSSDYPGATLSAALAERLGLPGPGAAQVLACAHKIASRRAQREAAPEATADFWGLDPTLPDAPPPGLSFPCFVKPVKGSYSVLARRIDSPAELAAFLARPQVTEFAEHYLRIFRRAFAAWSPLAADPDLAGAWFLAEELLTGEQVTVEGWCAGGEVGVLGVVDSVLHPATRSFLRFDYPSSLPAEVQARMVEIVRRTMRRLPLDRSLFNVELLWDRGSDRIAILEINPRLCGQFGDLYAKVDGVHGYEVALALAVGDAPPPPRGGTHRVAASVPLRVFEPVRVVRAPGDAELAAAEALFPDTLVWSECAAGDELADFFSGEDGASARYGVLNLGAPDRETLLARAGRVLDTLGYRFEPASPPRRSTYL